MTETNLGTRAGFVALIGEPRGFLRGTHLMTPTGWRAVEELKAGDVVIVEGMARIFFPGMPVQLAQDGTAKG